MWPNFCWVSPLILILTFNNLFYGFTAQNIPGVFDSGGHNPHHPQHIRLTPVARGSLPTHTRKPVIEVPQPPVAPPPPKELRRVNFKQRIQLDSIPKTYYTQYTYFYTIVDGTNTRKSTRAGVVSSKIDTPVDLAKLKMQSTVQDGFVKLGSGRETVHLGRRAIGSTTTEVNLAMETYLKFEGISNAIIESVPTSLPTPIHKATTPLPDTVTLRDSFGSFYSDELLREPVTSSTTPEIPAVPNAPPKPPTRSRRPGVRISSVQTARGDGVRSRVAVSGRPGQRVRVRPHQVKPTGVDLSPPPPPTALSPNALNTRKPVIEVPQGPPPQNDLRRLEYRQLDSLPKTLYTQYTYFYTIVDGSNTRKSTRAEVVSSRLDSPIDLAKLKIHSTVQDGYVSLGSGPETVHLGRRSLGKSTTEVNLAMQTYVKLEGITNALIESIPTSVPDPIHKATSPLPVDHQPPHPHPHRVTSSRIRSSFVSASPLLPSPSELPSLPPVLSSSPPVIPTDEILRDHAVVTSSLSPDSASSLKPPTWSRRPGVRVSSVPASRVDVLRSRVVGRPGLRVRVRPSSRIVSSAYSSHHVVSPSFLEPEVSSSSVSHVAAAPLPTLSSSAAPSSFLVPSPSSSSSYDAPSIYPTPTLDVGSLPTSAFEFDPNRDPYADPAILSSAGGVSVLASRKRVTVTRRPFGGLSRLRTRPRPGATPSLSSTTSSAAGSSSSIITSPTSESTKVVVITRSGSPGRVSVAPGSNRFRVTSRIVRPHQTSSPSLIAASSSSSSSSLPSLSSEEIDSSLNNIHNFNRVKNHQEQEAGSSSSSGIGTNHVVNPNGQTVSISLTTIPVVYGLDTSYRTLTISSTLTTPSLLVSPTASFKHQAAGSSSSVLLSLNHLNRHNAEHNTRDSSPDQSINSLLSPSQAVVITYFTTTTHTIPFTAGDKTLYTTFEITNSRVATENLPLDARGSLLTTSVNNDGVTLVVASSSPGLSHVSKIRGSATLNPTLVEGAMSDGISVSPTPSLQETRTMYTTFTFFTTFYTDDSSIIKSSEQVISNVITVPVTDAPHPHHPPPPSSSYDYVTPSPSVIPSQDQPYQTPSPSITYSNHRDTSNEPITVIETSEKIETSTIYSTQTFFATLFNGSTSMITPIEETKTEVLTLREPIRITRTISPQEASKIQSAVITRTYYTTHTNLVEKFSGDKKVTATEEETVSNVVTFTVPGYSVVSHPPEEASPTLTSPVYTPIVISSPVPAFESGYSPEPTLFTTRITHTTLTHFITLFSGSQTVLSSIEEISPTIVTEAVGQTQHVPVTHSPHKQYNNIERTQYDSSGGSSARDLMTSFIPSVSTLYTTHTYYTTLFSGTTSIISSRADVTSSLVTLYVPASGAHPVASSSAASPSSSYSSGNIIISATPSLISSHESNVKSSVGILSADANHGERASDVILTRDFILTSTQPLVPVSSSKYDEIDSSIISKVFNELKSKSQGLSDEEISSAIFAPASGKSTKVFGDSTIVFFTDFIVPSKTSLVNTEKTASVDGHKPSGGGSTVVDLEDILSGSGSSHNLNQNLGAAIKDIVHLLNAANNKQSSSNTSRDHLEKHQQESPTGETPRPVYIPIGSSSSSSSSGGSERNKPKTTNNHHQHDSHDHEIDLAPVFKPDPNRPAAAHHPNLEPSVPHSNDRHHDTSSHVGVPRGSSSATPALASSESPSQHSPHTPSLPDHRSSPSVGSAGFAPESSSRAVYSQVGSGATTIFFGDNDADKTSVTFRSAGGSVSSQPTRYVTSVEPVTRTLTLTTTKVYYTRDAPLTITSVLTTVIPPKTFVSTIIGSRTILGTATEPTRIAPSEVSGEGGSTTVTTTTLIFNSITTTVVRTLVIPTTGIAPTKPVVRVPVTKAPGTVPGVTTGRERGTRKPLVSVRTTSKTTPPPVAVKPAGSTRRRQPLPKPTPPPELVPTGGSGSSGSSKPKSGIITGTSSVKPAKVIPLKPVLDDDQCSPACNTGNKEVCRETDEGKFKCDCRPGFARPKNNSDGVCREMNNYILLVRVMKVGEDEISYNKDLADTSSGEFKKLAKLTQAEVDKAYGLTEVKKSYLGADVTGVARSFDDEEGVLVNLTLRFMSDDQVNEDTLREELVKSLEESTEALPHPAFITAEVEDVMDFDECSDPNYNDCSEAASCINEPGSYTCKCKGIFTDISADPTLPGRSCAAEVKSCDQCNGRGDCYRDESGDITSCKCHRMYLGRYCEINGILLATLLPVGAILSIISICCIVYCCRKYKKRTNISKGFRNISSFGPATIGAGTLDRKAMLETSSDNSDHYHRNHHASSSGAYVNHTAGGGGGHMGDHNGGTPHASMDPDSNGSTPRRRRGSEPSLDRSLGASTSAAYNNHISGVSGMPPQVVIPRARHPNQPPEMMLMMNGHQPLVHPQQQHHQHQMQHPPAPHAAPPHHLPKYNQRPYSRSSRISAISGRTGLESFCPPPPPACSPPPLTPPPQIMSGGRTGMKPYGNGSSPTSSKPGMAMMIVPHPPNSKQYKKMMKKQADQVSLRSRASRISSHTYMSYGNAMGDLMTWADDAAFDNFVLRSPSAAPLHHHASHHNNSNHHNQHSSGSSGSGPVKKSSSSKQSSSSSKQHQQQKSSPSSSSKAGFINSKHGWEWQMRSVAPSEADHPCDQSVYESRSHYAPSVSVSTRNAWNNGHHVDLESNASTMRRRIGSEASLDRSMGASTAAAYYNHSSGVQQKRNQSEPRSKFTSVPSLFNHPPSTTSSFNPRW